MNNFLSLNPANGKKIFFASDFHLGSYEHEKDKREEKVVAWLKSIENQASAIFLLGDIFDFWYEYKHVVPKGHIRFLGQLMHMIDAGVNVYFFTGNHDKWFFDYFPKEFNIPVYEKPLHLKSDKHDFLIAHGDGLGPGDETYK